MSSQRKLDFPVKKVTRSSAGRKKNADGDVSLIKRTNTDSRVPVAMTRFTPSRDRSNSKVNSPAQKDSAQTNSARRKSKSVQHTVIVKIDNSSGETIKDIPALLADNVSPVKIDKARSPLVKFSEISRKQCTPAKMCEAPANISPRKRQLNFDDLEKIPKLACSPKKQQKKENCPSPVKELTSPTPRGKSERSPKLQLFRPNVSSYTKTRQALHTAQPDRLLCREKELGEVDTFMKSHLCNRTPGSMYISGAPGTGKTAVLSHLLKVYKDKCLKPVFINCMLVNSSVAIFNAILTQLTDRSSKAKSAKDAQRQLEKLVTSKGQMILLVLDEIDQLDSKNQEVLYTMFEWPSLNSARLVLIGIANALDLTDRILPRLQARPKCRPKLVNFPPYSKTQIVSILEDRLKESLAEGNCVMEPHAIQFCARKVSAVAGDMRKALDICRRAVEKMEVDVRGQQVLKPSATNSPRKTPQTTVSTKVGVGHIAKVVSEVYGSKVTTSTSQKQTIPLQQKMIVCSLLVMLKHGKTKEVTVAKLHEIFLKICKKRNMASTDQSEFISMLSLLDTGGVLQVKKAKEQRMAKVSMKLDEQEVEHALQDKVLMSSILNDGIPA